MSKMTYTIPHRVNKPLILAFFTLDQFIPIFIAVVLGYTFKAGMEAMIFGTIYFQVSGYFAKYHPRGFVEHSLWRMGLLRLKLGNKFPDSLKRDFYR